MRDFLQENPDLSSAIEEEVVAIINAKRENEEEMVVAEPMVEIPIAAAAQYTASAARASIDIVVDDQ